MFQMITIRENTWANRENKDKEQAEKHVIEAT